MNDHLAHAKFREDMPNRTLPRVARRVTLMFFAACGVLLCSSFLVHAEADFANYNVPLYDQIKNRIKAKILARLGEGKSARDRYFIIPFAHENKGNDARYSHSFISVIRVLADEKQPKRTPRLKLLKYKNREFEAFTISWLPHDFATNPHLCVFDSGWSRLFPKLNKCPSSVGKNFTLPETIQLASSAKNAVAMWGPYEIGKGGFDLGVKRMRLLDGGTIRYRADDRLYLKDRTVINCFHAMSDLIDPFPAGGIFGTGFKMWGINGTARVLIEYTKKPNFRKLLLEPVDEKRDRYGFVYAPTPESRRIFNPFVNASAYRR